jgi:hypothetical protein
MMKKLEREKIAPKIASQPPNKQVQKVRDEKVEYARSVFLNAKGHISRVKLDTKMVTSTILG